jgi:hypothetical protein
MSAQPESTTDYEATVEPLYTDHYLEHEYGHLSPSELANEAINPKYHARMAQLQIAAMYLINHTSDEMIEWIKSYHVASDQLSNDTTYI